MLKDKMNDVISLLALAGTAFNTIVPQGQQEKIFKAGVMDVFSSVDEAIFDELLSRLSEMPDGEEAKDEILNWLTKYPMIGHKFRKYITCHENQDARLSILVSYANEKSHEHRCRRLAIVSIPPEFLRKLKLRLGELGLYLTDDAWEKIKEQKFGNFFSEIDLANDPIIKDIQSGAKSFHDKWEKKYMSMMNK